MYVNRELLNISYVYMLGIGNYGGIFEGILQIFFDWSFCKKLGLDLGGNDYINIDVYDFFIFFFGMFFVDEFFNSGNIFVEYYGYDCIGKKVCGIIDIDDYFNKLDENGNYQ